MTDHCEVCGSSESHDVCVSWDDISYVRIEAHRIWLSLPKDPPEVTQARQEALDQDARAYYPTTPRARYERRRYSRKHSTGMREDTRG